MKGWPALRTGPRWTMRWIVRCVLLAGAAVLACREAPPGLADVRHVVLVVLDTTHAAHLGCYGGPAVASPALDAVAARGVRFAAAYSNTTWTLPSTATLLSGLLPETHGVVTANSMLPAELPLVTERLHAAGWRTDLHSQMVFASARHGFDRGIDGYGFHGSRGGEAQLLDALRSWLSARGAQPSLLYVHLRRPHSPYDPAPAFRRVFEDGCSLADGRRDEELARADARPPAALDAAELAHLEHLYAANLRQADDRLAEFFDGLRAATQRDTLLIVTSDHGEGLGEHGAFGHGATLWAEQVRIPLLVVGPGLRPHVVEQPVSSVDIAPTLYDLCGVPPPDRLEGRSLRALLEGRALDDVPIPLSGRREPHATPEVGVVSGRWKLVLGADGAWRLHDRVLDPREREPLALEQLPAGLLEAMQRQVRALAAWQPAQPAAEAPALDAQSEAELRQLGYLR